MINKIMRYLEEGVKNELNVSQLYAVFYSYYPEDYQLWWNLSMEEVNHASLLKSAVEFYKLGKSPFQINENNLQILIDLNKNFPSILEEFKKNPSRKKSFEIALKLENSVGEIHYQQFMSNDDNDDQISKIFKKLNKDDKDHEDRIKKYIKENNIWEIEN